MVVLKEYVIRQYLQFLHYVALMVVVQVSLGIATLLSQVSLPLAVMHQGGAMVLLGVLIWARSEALPADYSADRKEQNV